MNKASLHEYTVNCIYFLSVSVYFYLFGLCCETTCALTGIWKQWKWERAWEGHLYPSTKQQPFPAGVGCYISHAIICYLVLTDRSGSRTAGGGRGSDVPAERDKHHPPLSRTWWIWPHCEILDPPQLDKAPRAMAGGLQTLWALAE